MAIRNNDTPRLDECWTYTRLCEQVVSDVVSKKLDMPSSYAVDSCVGTVGLAFHQTSRPTSLLDRLHVTASSGRVLVASSPNSTKFQPVTEWQPRKSDGYWPQCRRSHRRSTYCHVRCRIRTLMSSHQSSLFANLSLHTGKFPSCYKKVQVLPLLKKSRLENS